MKCYTSISEGITYFVAKTSKKTGQNGSNVLWLDFISYDSVSHYMPLEFSVDIKK